MEQRGVRGKVLILTPQPMTGALLGMLVELAQLDPTFAAPDERPEDALARVRPLLVVVADGDIDAHRSDLFVARAAHRGVGVVVFGSDGESPASEWARQRELPFLRLPADAEAFGRILDRSIQTDRRSRLAGDRRASTTERAVDGTLVFHDVRGTRWYVYDRRMGERRRLDAPPLLGDLGYRAFVSDEGVELRCALSAQEFRDQSAEGLERQLARAT